MAGNAKSGRKGYGPEVNYFKELDKAIPEAVRACVSVIKDCQLNLLKENLKASDAKGYMDTIIRASQVLISKAPQRIAGTGEAGEIIIKQVTYGEGNNSTV